MTMTPEAETVGAILQYGPLVAIIGFLLKANAAKDKIISELSSQAMQMAVATRQVAQIVKDRT